MDLGMSMSSIIFLIICIRVFSYLILAYHIKDDRGKWVSIGKSMVGDVYNRAFRRGLKIFSLIIPELFILVLIAHVCLSILRLAFEGLLEYIIYDD